MSFLPTAFLTFVFGDERERQIRRELPFQEREEEVQESCGKAWHGPEELLSGCTLLLLSLPPTTMRAAVLHILPLLLVSISLYNQEPLCMVKRKHYGCYTTQETVGLIYVGIHIFNSRQ